VSAVTLPNQGVDPGHFRRVLGQYPTGVCVVTAVDLDGRPAGMTVGSFVSVSLNPPLVAFLATTGSRVLAAIGDSGRFAVNALAGDQVDLCRQFASRADDRFDGVSWRPSALGSPVLAGAPAWVDCRLDAVTEVGDHVLVVGAVADLDVERSAAPLMFFQGGYGRFSALSVVAGAEDDLGTHLRLAELARPRLEHVSARFGVHTAASALVGEPPSQQVVQLAWVSAEGGDLDAELEQSPVGLRLPFVAPFGPLFAAWQDGSAREAWLAGHAHEPLAPDVRQVLLDDLADARARGWATLPDHRTLRAIEASIARLAAAGQLPDEVKELKARITQFAQQYTVLREERPRGVSVPVFDRSGNVVLALTAHRLPDLKPADLARCREALVEAAAGLTAAVGGVRRHN
jgi:flavin reductase (DIM6/NTAB) family NADH-FMN oxidoreductase RutF/DNA-binding IclR family transcriptional regulator